MTELKLKRLEREINQSDPWADDKLERQKCADALTSLIRDMPESIVLSLNGHWGSGKTFMLKRWQTDLIQKGFSTLYFNAWEDDYCNDPLVAILGQLRKHIGKEKLENVTKYAMPLLKAGANMILKSATGGTVNLDDIGTENNVFDEYDDAKTNLKKLKESLIEVIQQIADEGKTLPLVFIIDELDRCRPSFAIELLERIKHIFDIPNVIFVLGIDRKQLGHSIKSVYGQDMDVEGYLHRFIDINFILPEVHPGPFCEHLLSYLGVESFLLTRGKGKTNKDDYNDFKDFFPKLCYGMKLTLREIEYGIRLFVLASKNTQEDYKLYPLLLSVLIVLKLKNENLYKKYTTNQCLVSEVLDFICDDIPHNIFSDHSCSVLEAYVYSTDHSNYGENIVKEQLILQVEGKSLTKPRYLSKRTKKLDIDSTNQILNFYKHITDSFDMRMSRKTLNYLTEKIELASSFLGKDY
jgi:hypothetical protein